MCDEEDLDALLDEAMDVMDRQDKEHEEEIRERDAKVAQLMEEQQPRHTGDEAALVNAVASLLEVLRKGPEALEKAPADEMDRIQSMLASTLEGMKDGATCEELDSITRCSELLKKAGEAEKEPSDPNASTLSEEEVKNMQSMIDSLQKSFPTSGLNLGSMAAQAGATSGRGDASEQQDAATATEGSEVTQDTDLETLKMMFELLQPKTVIESFSTVINAFPIWFERHGHEASAEDLERYRRQEKKMKDVVELVTSTPLEAALKPDASEDERQRLLNFSSLLEELQALGMPPQSINDIVAEQKKQEEEGQRSS